MKLAIKALTVVAAIIFAQTVGAREALLSATIEKIKVVSIDPAVQEQLRKSSHDQRKILEAVIHTGNLFVRQHFAYNAYDTTPENSD